jgi:hypothetical protein
MAARKSAKPADGEAAVVESEFSKEQLLSAKRFQGRKDIVNALLMKSPDTATFTVNAVEEMIENYMKGQVK